MFKKNFIFSAVIPIFIASLMLVYSSYAWAEMSKEVSVNGIQLHIVAPNDIQLSWDNLNWSHDITADANYFQHAGLIMPASSLDGFDHHIFQTTSAKVNGQTDTSTIFQEATGITAQSNGEKTGYYMDVPLYFRTPSETDVTLYLDAINAKISPIIPGKMLYKCARVAFLKENSSDGNSLTLNATGTTAPLVFAPADQSTATVVTSISDTGNVKSPTQYLTFSGGRSSVPVVSVKSADYTGGLTYVPTKIILRIWVEGEDDSCVSSVGGQQFSIDLGFDM